MRRIGIGLFVAAWMSQLAVPAFAINDTINVTVGTGTTKTANLIAFGGGNVISEVGICDATTANQCATINSSGQISVVLPAGFSTSALQTTGNTELATINTTLGTPFQAGGTIANTSFAATQATGSNLHMVCDSGCSGSGGTSSAFGSAFPATGTAIGLTNGTNMVAWSATTNFGTAPAAIPVPAMNVSDAALLAAAATPLPSMPVNKTPHACGGTIGTGGTAVNNVLGGAQTTLQTGTIMNLSPDPMWISFTGNAAIGGANDSFLLPAGSSTIAGGSWTFPAGAGTNHDISVNAATNGDAWSCVWWSM